MIRTTAAGVEIDVRVIPRSSRTGLGGIRDHALLIRLAAPPVEGAANDALIAFLAKALGVSQRSVRILTGATGRRKRVAVDGVTADAVRHHLAIDHK